MEVFFEIHKDLPRQAPGLNKITRKALEMLDIIPHEPDILDIGCGSGTQTLELVKYTSGKVIAVDTYNPFLKELEQKAKKENLLNKIQTRNISMSDMEFKENQFDLIWSEGSIYIMGFETGLKEWKKILKPGGYIAVSEISWIRKKIPQAPMTYWNEYYPDMKNVSENINIIEDLGFTPIGHYVLPQTAWWKPYYTPLSDKIPTFKEKYKNNSKALDIIHEIEFEIEMFRKYSDNYSYVFYIMQKINS